LIKVLDRILLFVYSLVIGIASIVAIVAAAGGVDRGFLNDSVDEFTGGSASVQAAVIIVAALLLLFSLRFFVVSVKRDGSSAPSINQRTDHGEIRISVETVENIALKAASRTKGIKDIRARVSAADSGLKITVRAFIDGESSIPALSEEMQKMIAEQVEETTGVPVAEVSVYIANVIQAPSTYKSRVE